MQYAMWVQIPALLASFKLCHLKSPFNLKWSFRLFIYKPKIIFAPKSYCKYGKNTAYYALWSLPYINNYSLNENILINNEL